MTTWGAKLTFQCNLIGEFCTTFSIRNNQCAIWRELNTMMVTNSNHGNEKAVDVAQCTNLSGILNEQKIGAWWILYTWKQNLLIAIIWRTKTAKPIESFQGCRIFRVHYFPWQKNENTFHVDRLRTQWRLLGLMAYRGSWEETTNWFQKRTSDDMKKVNIK